MSQQQLQGLRDRRPYSAGQQAARLFLIPRWRHGLAHKKAIHTRQVAPDICNPDSFEDRWFTLICGGCLHLPVGDVGRPCGLLLLLPPLPSLYAARTISSEFKTPPGHRVEPRAQG